MLGSKDTGGRTGRHRPRALVRAPFGLPAPGAPVGCNSYVVTRKDFLDFKVNTRLQSGCSLLRMPFKQPCAGLPGQEPARRTGRWQSLWPRRATESGFKLTCLSSQDFTASPIFLMHHYLGP